MSVPTDVLDHRVILALAQAAGLAVTELRGATLATLEVVPAPDAATLARIRTGYAAALTTRQGQRATDLAAVQAALPATAGAALARLLGQ